MAPIDLIACLVTDELTRRSDRFLVRRRKQAAFRDPQKTLDNFDFTFNPKMNRSLVFDLATSAFIGKREDALFLGPGGTGKRHLAQAIGQAAIQQGYRVMYRETHVLLDDLAETVAEGTRKEFMESLAAVPLLIIDDFGMRKLPLTAAEDLPEIIMRRYERASTLLTSNRPVDDWGKMLGDVAAVTAMLDRLLDHAHVLNCGPRSPPFLKVCSYAPWAIKLCLNGHEWAKRQLARRKTRYEALDNGFLWCAEPEQLQQIYDSLGTEHIDRFFSEVVATRATAPAIGRPRRRDGESDRPRLEDDAQERSEVELTLLIRRQLA